MSERIAALRARRGGQFAIYAAIGILNLVFYVGGVWALARYTPIPDLWVNTLMWVLATVNAYVANYALTFSSDRPHGPALVKYLAVVLVGIALNALFVWAVVDVLNWPVWIGSALFVIIWPVASFVVQKVWVFGG